jgi:ATP-dependent protease HslVU (ClpYQ) peptidase subunit
MSIIAVNKRNGKISMAADSQVTVGDSVIVPDHGFKKLRKIKGALLAVCGGCDEGEMFFSFYAANKVPKATKDGIFTFFAGFYKKRDSFNESLKADQDISLNTYIVALNGKVFVVNDTFVIEIKAGNSYAIGDCWIVAMALMDEGISPKRAVESVCRYSTYCSLPVISYEVPYGK